MQYIKRRKHVTWAEEEKNKLRKWSKILRWWLVTAVRRFGGDGSNADDGGDEMIAESSLNWNPKMRKSLIIAEEILPEPQEDTYVNINKKKKKKFVSNVGKPWE